MSAGQLLLLHKKRPSNRGILLPQNLLLSSGTLWEDFETAGDWTVANGSLAANTSQFKTGTQSLKLTANSGATATMTKTVNWDLSGSWGGLSFWFYIHNDPLSDYGSNLFNIQLANDAGVSNTMRSYYFKAQSLADAVGSPVGWQRVYIPKAYFSATGSGTFASPIIRMRLTIVGAASKTPAISFDDFEVGEKHQAAILFRFDDYYLETYNYAYTYMKGYNIRGTAYTQTGAVGQVGPPAGFTWANLREMDAAGWAIANHTRDHTHLKDSDQATQTAAIQNAIDDLTNNGVPRCAKYLAYPGGGTAPDFNATTFTVMQSLGVLTGHTTRAQSPGAGYVGSILPYQLYPTNSLYYLFDQSFSTAITLAQGKALVDECISAGTILMPLFHQLVASGQWVQADFNALIDYVYAKWKSGLITPITIDDLYKLSLGPARVPKVI